jgi:phosphinothricin acetyltransferase
LTALLQTLERQGYVAAIWAIALPNEASVTLHEKLGFFHTGSYRQVGFKLGEWIDVGLWQRDLVSRTARPAEVLPFLSIRPAE